MKINPAGSRRPLTRMTSGDALGCAISCGPVGILRGAEPGRAARTAQLLSTGYPAYATTPGWLGYDDEKFARLSVEAVEDGFRFIKLKVGCDLEENVRRMAIARAAVGPDIAIAIDANQRWEVAVADFR